MARIKKVVIAITIITILGFLPEWVISSKIDYSKVKLVLEDVIKKSTLAISFDGIKISAYKGIMLYQVSISSSEDFSNGKPFLKSEFVRIEFSWKKLLFEKKFVIDNIILENSKISLWLEKGKLGSVFYEQLLAWKEKLGNIKLISKDFELKIQIKDKKYKKKKIFISHFNFSYNNSSNFKFSFSDDYWGKASGIWKLQKCAKIVYQKNICVKWPSLLTLKYSYFPLKDFRWFFSHWQFQSGYLIGSFKLQNETIGNKVSQKISLSGEAVRPWVNKNEVVFYRSPKLLYHFNQKREYLATRYRLKNVLDDNQFVFNARSYKALLSYKNNIDNLWPTNFSLKIIKTNALYDSLLLPFNTKVHGLKKFELSFEKSKKIYDKPYRNFNANFVIENGVLQWKGLNFVNLNLTFGLKKNDYKLRLSFKHNQSDFNTNLIGDIYTREVPYFEILYGTYSDKVYQRQRKLVSFQSNHKGSMKINKFDYGTQSNLIKYLLKKVRSFTTKSLSKPYAPARFREEPFFLQNLFYSTAKIALNIEQFEYANNKVMPIEANLDVSNSRFTMSISGKKKTLLNTKEFIDLNFLVDYKNNYPFMMLNYNFDLTDNFEFINSFFEAGFIKKAQSAKVKFEATSGGDSFGNLYSSWKSEGNYSFGKVQLNNFGSVKNTPVYDELNFITKSIGKVGWIYGISAFKKENNITDYLLNGSGQWTDLWKNSVKNTQYFWYLNQKKLNKTR